MTEPKSELIYSGVVMGDDGEDLLSIFVVKGNKEEFLWIETKKEPVRAMIRLDKRQANVLARCLRIAVARWDGREE